MIQRFRVRFEPVRVVDHADTEGKPAAQYIEATAAADATDKSLDHDKLWKTPAPQANLQMTLHDAGAMKFFGTRQPFFVEFVMEAPDEPKAAATTTATGKKAKGGKKSRSKKKSARKRGSATSSLTSGPSGKATPSRPKRARSRASTSGSTPSPRTKVARKTAGTSTSAPPVKDQPVTNPGGNQ